MNYYRNVISASEILSGKVLSIPIIKCPTLVIWGERDIALEKDLPELTREYVDNMKVEYLPRGNHFIQNDLPNEVNKSMEHFLK